MLKALTTRIAMGICFALVTVLLAAAVGEASPQVQEGPVRTDCQDCHESVVTHWEKSAHGQATNDLVFQEAWNEEGSPSECLTCHTTGLDLDTGQWETDGIACSVCHSPQEAPHPETAMPTDPSSRLCGTCHIDTYNEWQVSTHGEGEMTCVRCHNPHTTGLKVGNMQDLCSTCHNEEGHYFPNTAHAQQGLLCTDCHLRVTDSEMGEGHGRRQHTFNVDLKTCNECHGDEMHLPAEGTTSMWSEFAATNRSVSNINNNPVSDEPESTPAHPFNYAVVAVVGLAFGVAVTPYAEGWVKRFQGKDRV
jgi:formate-dependent nitrite reductase cytochrome c552 subunit